MKARMKSGSSATANSIYDVVIVGGGPAGSTLAWRLASNGIRTLILDAAKFPREKVCGDYVEPRGLRILRQMGGLEKLETADPLPITHSSTYIGPERHYLAKIPFYGVNDGLPPHGYIVPRAEFDSILLDLAGGAGADIQQECYVNGFSITGSVVEVCAVSRGKQSTFRARIIVGADGVNSVVARTAGILVNDPRHIALSQRAYAEGFVDGLGEAAFFFDRDFFPGYGWMFPMRGGRVNLGVGILKEACQRHASAVPQIFREFFEKLKRSHPRCRNLKLVSRPVGGIVKTYGGAGPNYFDRGLLVGDAGSFIDPMTGEGITPAMESALIAAQVILAQLRNGQLNAVGMSSFHDRYRKYFDPAMVFGDLCAATLRNPHYWESWKKALVRGCQLAQRDVKFAATAGACFGGLEVKPAGILAAVWTKTAENLIAGVPKMAAELFIGKTETAAFALQELTSWIEDSSKSFWANPYWHTEWVIDVQRKWLNALTIISGTSADPRINGVI